MFLLFHSVLELLQDFLHLLRHREPQVRRVLQKAHALVGEVKEDDRRAKDAACADHLHIQDVGYPSQQEICV